MTTLALTPSSPLPRLTALFVSVQGLFIEHCTSPRNIQYLDCSTMFFTVSGIECMLMDAEPPVFATTTATGHVRMYEVDAEFLCEQGVREAITHAIAEEVIDTILAAEAESKEK